MKPRENGPAKPRAIDIATDCGGAITMQVEDSKHEGAERGFGTALLNYVREAWGCPTLPQWAHRALEPGWRDGKYLSESRGTPNHRFLARVLALWRARREGNAADIAHARRLVNDFIEAQWTSKGWLYGETLTTSHDPIWTLALMCARAYALHYGDAELLEATGRDCRARLWLYRLLARPVPGGEEYVAANGFAPWVFSPAAREAGPYSEFRTVEYCTMVGAPYPPRLDESFALSDRPIPGRPNEPFGPWWQHERHVGAWMMRRMIVNGDDLGGATKGCTEQAVLRDPLFVETRGADKVARVPYVTKSSNFLWWVAYVDGVTTFSETTMGEINNRPCPFDPPDTRGWERVIVPGVA